jgi:hypothetical protein
VQQAYAPQPAANPQYAAPGAAGDQFVPPIPTGGARPSLAKIGAGRHVLIFPTKIERDVVSNTFKNNDGSPQKNDRLTADIVVLDGPPFMYGGSTQKMTPDTLQAVPGPMSEKFMGVYVSGKIVIGQCERSVDEKGRRSILGRLIQVPTQGQPGWKLDDPDENGKALAREWFARHPEPDQFSAPAPQPQAQPVQPAQQQYAPPAAQAYAPQQQYVQQPMPVAPQAPAQPQYAPPPPPPAPVAPAAPQPLACPPGIDPAWFAQQPYEAQLYYVQQAQQQPQAPAQPAPGAQGPWA